MNKWINPKKKMPYPGFEMIVCTSKHKVTVGYYSEDGVWSICGKETGDEIILWQPLPPLPKNLPMIELDIEDLEITSRGGWRIPPRSEIG